MAWSSMAWDIYIGFSKLLHFPYATFYRNARWGWCGLFGCWCGLCGCWCGWCGPESVPNCLALVVYTQSGDNQPANHQHSHGCAAAAAAVVVLRLSWGCGTSLSGTGLSGFCFCLFLSLPCQAVAFGKSFARSHAAGVFCLCALTGGTSEHSRVCTRSHRGAAVRRPGGRTCDP